MKEKWLACRKILCIRPDNMGDLIMSSPAIRALKETFNCHITVLTSSQATGIATHIPEIDEVLSFDFPWVKNDTAFQSSSFNSVVEQIKSKNFDGAIIFTVYSQNPLPSAMIAFMAEIPLRMAYCRENPYGLLTDWIPEKEPYNFIRHQVQRDLDLVANIGAITANVTLSLSVEENHWVELKNKLQLSGVDLTRPWIMLHPGVSETKRQFPIKQWTGLAKRLIRERGFQLLFTGTYSENDLVTHLVSRCGTGAFNLAGVLSLEEFILLIKKSPLVISVNTGTVHIAAAVQTPVIVFYALTNPQHAPWKAKGRIFPFNVSETMQSRNEVVKYVSNKMNERVIKNIDLEEILLTVYELIDDSTPNQSFAIPELINFPGNREKAF